MSDDFYVGYASRAPRATGIWLRNIVLLLLCGAVAIALILVFSQDPFPTAVFEYGQTRAFRGVLREHPVAALDLDNGRTALLVAPGKHGARFLVHGLHNHEVDLAGAHIQRDDVTMIEVVPGSIRAGVLHPAASPPSLEAGQVELHGEIVDSKCYLGVMNPGEGKVHRDCAARCISGGIPPALAATDSRGVRRLILLTGPGGTAINRQVLQYVGEPVAVQGRLFRVRDGFLIETTAQSVRRLE